MVCAKVALWGQKQALIGPLCEVYGSGAIPEGLRQEPVGDAAAKNGFALLQPPVNDISPLSRYIPRKHVNRLLIRSVRVDRYRTRA